MKKILMICVLAVTIMLPTTAKAENIIWSERSFDFSTVKNIKITKVTEAEIYHRNNYRQVPMGDRTMIQLVSAELTKKNIGVLDDTERAAAAEVTEQIKTLVPELELEMNINEYGYSEEFIPGRVETYTAYEKVVYSDSSGKVREVNIPVTRTRDIPGYYEQTGHIDVEMILVDPLSQKKVMTYRDMRNRLSVTNPIDMGKRVAQLFVKELQKCMRDKPKVQSTELGF